jgi:hypothetical protein
MKALQDFLRRLRIGALTKTAPGLPRANAPRVDFSYTIYWTKQVRAWDAARRAAVHEALLTVLGQPGFEANAYARRYTVPGLDEQAHSGASLIALKKVLAAFDNG